MDMDTDTQYLVVRAALRCLLHRDAGDDRQNVPRL